MMRRQLLRACATALLAFPVLAGAKAFSISDQASCYAAIERVYYEQRDWPDKSTRRPRFEDAYPVSAFASRVDDDSRMESALADLRGAALSEAEVQAEIDRIVSHSRDAETLRRIFSALGDDPQQIAECLVRPVLAQRLLRQRYAEAADLHTAERVQALDGYVSLQAGGVLGSASVHRVWSPADTETLAFQRLGKSPLAPIDKADAVPVEQRYASLAQALGLDVGAGAGALDTRGGFTSSLMETESSFTALRIEQGIDGMQVTRYAWPKRAFEDWWQGRKANASPMISNLAATFHLGPLDSGECLIGEWVGPTKVVDDYQPRYSLYADAVWTGTEMAVYGYAQGNFGAPEPATEGGVRFSPAGNTWSVMSAVGEPTSSYPGSVWHGAWTGSQLVVMECAFTDASGSACTLTGSRYSPATDTWVAIGTTGAVLPTVQSGAPRLYWTGSNMLVWVPGGYYSSGGQLGSYDPVANAWQLLAAPPANEPSYGQDSAIRGESAVWTGTELVAFGVAGCITSSDFCGDPLKMEIYIYNVASDQWRSVNYGANLSTRDVPTLAWSGSEAIFWGGDVPTFYPPLGNTFGVPTNTGAKYNPATNVWTAMSASGAPTPRDSYIAQWTGSKLVIWGGLFINLDGTGLSFPTTGGIYSTSSNTWVPTQPNGTPFPRTHALSTWTGSEVIIWGGDSCTSTSAGSDSQDCNSGGRFNPASNSWSPLLVHGSDGALTARDSFSMAGSGSDALVFGGHDGYPTTDSALYRPATDDWLRVPTSGEPALRNFADIGWSGNTYIVWGGTDSNTGQPLTDGARFDPVAQIWIPMAAVPATFLSQRGTYTHSAGAYLYLWGGANIQSGQQYNDGLVYDAASNVWSALSSTNAPDGRLQPLSQVDANGNFVLWGGYDQSTGAYPTTGAVYQRSATAWIPIQSAGNVPSANNGDFEDSGWASVSHVALLSDGDVFLWDQSIANGWRYDTGGATWQMISTAGEAPPIITGGDGSQSVLATTRDVLLFGGAIDNQNPPSFASGYSYSLDTGGWSALPSAGSPAPRAGHAAVAIGNRMMIWGGNVGGAIANTGGLYCFDNRTGTLSTDLAFSGQFSPDVITLGSPATLEIGASNAGPDMATNISVTIDTTSNFAFDQLVTVGADCTLPAQGASGLVTCQLGSLASGDSASVTVQLNAFAAGSFTLHGSVTGAEPDPVTSNNAGDVAITVSDPDQAADIAFSAQFVPATTTPDTPVNLVLGVSNAGPHAASNASVSVDTTADIVFESIATPGVNCSTPAVGASGKIACQLGAIASGASTSVTVVLSAPAVGRFTVTGTASANEADSNPANNSGSATLSVGADTVFADGFDG